MKILFLVGIDFEGLLVTLIILTAFGFAIFFLSKLFFTRVLGHFSVRQIFVLSIFSAVILAPLIFGLLFWVLISISF
jgi:hypothetical protein